ncbi:MAG: hypothetical protein PHN42_01450 [Bacilli bacterium]|nr:hypothetical protein [Bacilli bacterium]
MIIDITRLNSGIDLSANIENDVMIEQSYIDNTEIMELKNVKLFGSITKDSEGHYIDCELSGTMILPDSLTLKPVEYDFLTEINGNIEELLNEIGENDKKIENTIDIFPIIWENILMEIPIRVESEETRDVKLEGNGWRLVTDDDTSDLNPELQKLKDLLK